MKHILQKVTDRFFPGETVDEITDVKSGLINQTWKVDIAGTGYVFQRLNSDVFVHPGIIHGNLDCLKHFVDSNGITVPMVLPLVNSDGQSLVTVDGQFYRVFPWIKGGRTVDVVENTDQAYGAAGQFGAFTSAFGSFDCRKLTPSIPDFHNLRLRYTQFKMAVKNGNPSRISASGDLIRALFNHQHIVDLFDKITGSRHYKVRVMHHDAKISNVLLDEKDGGLCVIDLDTVMPGYIFSDWGDMLRTYVCPVSEEEGDFSKIIIRKEYFEAINEAYLEQMADILSEEERQSLAVSGQILIYMQAIRFLTDHLNDDAYYGAAYESHNFVRAGNQLRLLEELQKFVRSERSYNTFALS